MDKSLGLLILFCVISGSGCHTETAPASGIDILVEKIQDSIKTNDIDDFRKISLNGSCITSMDWSFIYYAHGALLEKYEYYTCSEAKKFWPELINRPYMNFAKESDYILKIYWYAPAPRKTKIVQDFLVKKNNKNEYVVFSLIVNNKSGQSEGVSYGVEIKRLFSTAWWVIDDQDQRVCPSAGYRK